MALIAIWLAHARVCVIQSEKEAVLILQTPCVFQTRFEMPQFVPQSKLPFLGLLKSLLRIQKLVYDLCKPQLQFCFVQIFVYLSQLVENF